MLTNMDNRKVVILLTWPIVWLVWHSTPHFIKDLNPITPFLLDSFFDGKDFGCKTIQSTPSRLWSRGVEWGNVLSIPKFLDGASAIWSVDELDPPKQPKSFFPLERECALTSLPLPPIEVSNGSTSWMAIVFLGTILVSWSDACCSSHVNFGSKCGLHSSFSFPKNSKNIDLMSINVWLFTCVFSNKFEIFPSNSICLLSKLIFLVDIFLDDPYFT